MFLFLFFLGTIHASNPYVRILLAKNIQAIKITGPALTIEEFLPNGNVSIHFLQDTSVKKPTLCPRVTGKKFLGPYYRIKTKNAFIYLDKKPFRGEMLIYPSSFGSHCDVINVVDVEQYLEWLVAKEMNTNWPLEALKAQAIAARSYALNRLEHNLAYSTKHYDLENSEKDQVSGHVGDETDVTSTAIRETQGLVLISPQSKKIIPGFFHSKCGGQTLAPDTVWPRKMKEIVPVSCPYCHEFGMGPWTYYGERVDLLNTIQKIIGSKRGTASALFKDGQNNTNLQVQVTDLSAINIKKSMIRNIIGTSKIPSNRFTLEINAPTNQFTIKGLGHGHGVGMCQFGAKGMANKGHNAFQIIQHYFPKLQLLRRY